MLNSDKARALTKKFVNSGQELLKSPKLSLKSMGRALTVTAALSSTAACVAPPHGPDRPNNSSGRTVESAIYGAIAGVAVADGNTKENLIGGLIGAALAGGLAYSNNQRNEARIQALREAGIQSIELPYRSNYRDETRVLLQLDPYATHKPNAGREANKPFVSSMVAIANAIDMYPIDSYKDVEVLYVMPEGCSREARANAQKLQSWLHQAVDLPVGVSPLLTRDGQITYNDALSQIGNRRTVFGQHTGDSSNFSINPGATCPDDAEGSANVVINNIKQSR